MGKSLKGKQGFKYMCRLIIIDLGLGLGDLGVRLYNDGFSSCEGAALEVLMYVCLFVSVQFEILRF